MQRVALRTLPMLLAVAVLARPHDARANDPTKAECVAANVSAQGLRRDGKLRAAREQLRLCADPACPAIVRDDCAQRQDDIERAQPTIVFEARDGSGKDTTAVTATVDGAPLASSLNGTPLPVEPGSHVFAFTFSLATAGPVTLERTLVIAEGEKGRREVIALAVPPAVGPVAPAPAPEPRAASGHGTPWVAGWIVGGVGVAGVAVGSIFGALTLAKASQQRSDCAGPGSCQSYSQAAADHTNGTTDGAVSTAGFITGGALLATGVVLLLTGRSRDHNPTATSLAPSVGPGTVGFVWTSAL